MSEQNQSNNKTIVKNTFFLYIRMIVITVVSLFTARITLQVLGIQDYGIYNVVGGIIGFLTFLTGTMTSATQRFLSFELGRNDLSRFNQIFSMLIVIFLLVSGVILILGSLVGIWMVNNILVIPKDRLTAANWVMFFSVLTFISNMVTIPYMSAIIAHERMSIYAYMSLLDALMKLLLVYLLYISPLDKLISYAFLTMASTALITFIYRSYCSKKLAGCIFHHYWEPDIFKTILRYTGWNLFGSVTSVLNQQGLTLVLNLFFGPLVNAAKAIADRINTVVISFSNNFYMAVTPRIIKQYSAGNYEQMRSLINYSSKYSFYLLLILTLPLIHNMKDLLVLWLGKGVVTEDTVTFSRLILAFSLINILEQPLTTAVRATGNIRNYQISVGVVTLSSLPITYLFFYYNEPAYTCFFVLIASYIIAHIIRLYICKKQVGLSIIEYTKMVIIPISLVTATNIAFMFYLNSLHLNWLANIIIEMTVCFCLLFLLGLSKNEKLKVLHFVQARISRKGADDEK